MHRNKMSNFWTTKPASNFFRCLLFHFFFGSFLQDATEGKERERAEKKKRTTFARRFDIVDFREKLKKDIKTGFDPVFKSQVQFPYRYRTVGYDFYLSDNFIDS